MWQGLHKVRLKVFHNNFWWSQSCETTIRTRHPIKVLPTVSMSVRTTRRYHQKYSYSHILDAMYGFPQNPLVLHIILYDLTLTKGDRICSCSLNSTLQTPDANLQQNTTTGNNIAPPAFQRMDIRFICSFNQWVVSDDSIWLQKLIGYWKCTSCKVDLIKRHRNVSQRLRLRCSNYKPMMHYIMASSSSNR